MAKKKSRYKALDELMTKVLIADGGIFLLYLLFETGNYNFSGEKMFYFSLARQFQFLDDNEYVQLRLEVTYAPSPKTALCYTTKWGSLTDGDFFAMVKGSRAFRIVRGLPIAEVNVRVEET